MLNIKKWLLAYFDSGSIEQDYGDTNRKTVIIYLFSFVGMAVTGLLSITHFINGNYFLATSLLLACSVYFISLYLHRATNKIKIPSNIILYSLFLLFSYLVYSGGLENTGPLWIFVFAPVALFIHGLTRGLIDIFLFIVVIAIIMFFPNNALLATQYSVEFKLRLLYSFATITFLSAFYEYSREQSYLFTLELSKKFEQLAKLDPLTQLANRREAIHKLEHEQLRLKRNNESLAIILCDIDLFKKINDNLGHNAGDKALIELAKVFTKIKREQDTIARWGGEEFLFILPQTSTKKALVFAEKVHQALAEHTFDFEGNKVTITVSMGVSELSYDQPSQGAIKIADEYLYQAKNAGRNQTFPKAN